MKIIIILIYIIIFILLIYFSINIEKYTNVEINKLDGVNVEINKLDGVNMYGNLTIKTRFNNFDNVNTLCIKNKCINIDKLNKLPYQKGISGQCTKEDCTKVCKCPYGTAPEGEDCKVHEKEICISCGKNYRFDNGTKTCIACEGEKFIDSENHRRTKCCSKTEKYNFDDTCSNKTCKCDNGEADNENCEIENEYKCKNCNENYYLNDAKCFKCEDEKYTQSGNRDRQCCPTGQHYDFTKDDCFINRCTCDGGYPTEGEDCAVHGSEDCSSCKGGKSGKYYYYSPSGIEGNKCIGCNLINHEIIYSDKHRITKCCPKSHIYNEGTNNCDRIYYPQNLLCRDGEKFVFEPRNDGYCECPGTEIYDLNGGICKEL